MNLINNSNLKPMLISENKTPFNNIDFIFEIKFDGTRALIFINNNKIIIKNRNGHILNEIFPELIKIKDKIKNNCIFDGEIVLLDNGYPSFEKLEERMMLKDKVKINYQSKNNPVCFMCFDILYENKDLTNMPLIKRRKILNKYSDSDIFIKTKYITNNGIELFKTIKKLNLEGIVAKEKNSKYSFNTRSKNWIKIKNLKEDIFYIGGYCDSTKGSLASLLLGKKTNNELIYKSSVTIGKNNPDYLIIKKQEKLKSSPFNNFNNKNYNYIKPTLKCSIKYTNKTINNSLRHPIFKQLELD